MKILIFYSGGKDSQACLIHSINKYGDENCEAVFCDTGWENPLTYDHIVETTKKMGVKLVILKSKKYEGMLDLAKKKKRFPSTKARFCTEELKSKPAIDYVLSHTENLIVIEGIRASESFSRSKMQAQCTYFKYYFEPITTNSDIINILSKKIVLSKTEHKKLNKAIERLSNGYEDPKYHTYRKNEVFEWCKNYNADKIRPLFDWSSQQVVDYIISYGQTPNTLYYQGFKRVGCFPCIMCTQSEFKLIIDNHKDRLAIIENHEIEYNSSFFKPDFIPKRFCTGVSKGKKYPVLKDVVKYLSDKNATMDMFEETTPSCMSAYNLCE